MRPLIMVPSIILLAVIYYTNINTDYILFGLIVVFAICTVHIGKMSKIQKNVYNVAVFITLMSVFILSNFIEGKPLVMYTVTAILVCIHIRFMKTKLTDDTLETKES